MGFERVTLFGIVEFDYIAPAGASVIFSTDLPGNAIAQRGPTLTLPVAATRRTVKFRLRGDIKGKKYRVHVSAGGMVILFGGRVYARPLGLAAPWDWYTLPIQPTADVFTEYKLPIEPTAETFTGIKIPMSLTPELLDWVDIPVAK